MEFMIGWGIGVIMIYFTKFVMERSYKRVLVTKAEDRSAEYINGEFYYIVPEDEYIKYRIYRLRDLDN